MKQRSVKFAVLASLVLMCLALGALPAAAEKGPPGPISGPEHVVLQPGIAVLAPEGQAGAEGQPENYRYILDEGFDGAFASTWRLSGHPTWAPETYRPFSGTGSAWCAGSDFTPPYPYQPSMDALMVWGPFSLDCSEDAYVLFSYWLDSEPGYDYFSWLASTDGTNFYGYKNSGHVQTWTSVNFDLTSVPTLGNLMGQRNVWLAFRFTSDSSGQYEGAYVDTVTIWRDSWFLPPYLGDLSPNSGSSPAGLVQHFVAGYASLSKWWRLRYCQFHVGTTTAQAGNALVRYDVVQNKLYMRNSAGTDWGIGYAPGTSHTLENNSAKLSVANTAVTKMGNWVTVDWAIQFKAAFKGTKNLYLKAIDKCNFSAGWRKQGTWTIF